MSGANSFRLRNELVTFLLRELNHPCADSCRCIDNLNDFIIHALSLCKDNNVRLQFLSRIYKSGGPGDLVDEFTTKQNLTVLIKLLNFFSAKQNYNDSQVALCLQAITALISNAIKLKRSSYSFDLTELVELQDLIFEHEISFNCLLANSVLLAQCLCYLESGSITQKIFETTPDNSDPFTKLFHKNLNPLKYPSRRLSVIFGLISVVSNEDFIPMAIRLLDEISIQIRSEDPFVGLLASFSFRQWTSRISKCQNEVVIKELLERNKLAPVFEFIYHKQGDPIDALREAAMDTYELLISLYHKYAIDDDESIDQSVVFERLLGRVVGQPIWMRNTLLLIQRFFAFMFREVKGMTSSRAIVWLLSAGFHLTVSTSIDISKMQSSERGTFLLACTLISAAEDVALAQSAGELYALFAAHFSPKENDVLNGWFFALVSMANQPQGVSRAFLDKVFNLSPLVPSMLIEKFSLLFTEWGLSTLLHAYRYCLTKKGLKRSPIALPNLALISRAFRSQDYQLNQQAIGVIELLLCQANLNSDNELINLFIEAIDIGVCWFDQGARSRMSALVTRVIERFLSLSGQEKDLAKRAELNRKLSEIFSRITSAILSHLHAGGVSTRSTNALAFLVAFFDVLRRRGVEKGLPEPLELIINAVKVAFKFNDNGDCFDFLLTSLISGLWSGFSEDRENAHKLIQWLGLLKYMKSGCLLRLWRQALTEVARSPRPDINVVGGHLVRCLLMAPSPSKSTPSALAIDRLLDVSEPHYRAVATAHYLLDTLDAQLRVTEAGRGGLLVASVTGPFYPLLNILRTLLHDPECCLSFEWFFKNPSLQFLPNASILERILKIAPHVARICSLVIFHSSPEGILMMVDEDGEHTKIIPSGAGEEDQWRNSEDFAALVVTSREGSDKSDCPKADIENEVVKALRQVVERPEHLVVNCWRSVREVALLFGGNLTREALLTNPKTPMLNIEQLKVMADFFISQLLRSRHPGAFELTASGFQFFCEILLEAKDYEDVSQWPEQWLSVVIADLTDFTIMEILTETGRLPRKYLQDAALCATRRSAGLPFFVQALLVVLHKTDRMGDLLNRTVNALLAEVNRGADATTVPSACKEQGNLTAAERRLHAMNVLKTLVRDATIGPLMGAHLEPILICAFQGLDSYYWMIRNAGLMLYSAMMERIFGVNRTRDCESKKNRMAASVFFTKFPGLRSFLLKALKESINELNSPTIGKTKLFSLLNLLKRLLPPIQQATTDGAMVQAFVPLVFRCAGAADIRIRLLGAKALVALLQPSCLPRIAHRLLLDVSLIFNSGRRGPHLPTNLIHGMFLQVLEMIGSEYWPTYNATLLQNGPHFEYLNGMSTLLSEMASECFDSSSNLCPIIRQTCLACVVAFGSSSDKLSAKGTSNNVLAVPSSLDVSTMELLVQLQDVLKGKDSSLEVLVKDVLNGSNPELKRLTLGLLVMYLNGKDVDFSKYGRLLWYEDVVNLLMEVSSPPYQFNPNGRCLDLSSCVPQLINEVNTSMERPYQPYSLIGYHASQLLASIVHAVSWNYQLPKLTKDQILPMHLGPLLTVKALTSPEKEKVLDLLASYVDARNPDIHWSIRVEAILAVDRLLSQDRSSVIYNLSINMAILKSLVVETDDEVLLTAATTASKILNETSKYPQDPLPPVILPPFLSNFFSTFGEVAITAVLKLIQEDLLAEESERSEITARVFVSEDSTVSTSVVELTTLFCSAVKAWIQSVSSNESTSLVVKEIRRWGLTEFLDGSLSEMDYSRMSEIKALRRTVAHLFECLIRELS